MATTQVRENGGVQVEEPRCTACGDFIIDHFNAETREYVGCPRSTVGEVIGDRATERPRTPRNTHDTDAVDAGVGIPGPRPRATAHRGSAHPGRNSVYYVVANARKSWSAKAIDADQGMTPREKQMFGYIVGKGKVIESESNVDLGEGGVWTKRLKIAVPFTNKACESALHQLRVKGYIKSVAVV